MAPSSIPTSRTPAALSNCSPASASCAVARPLGFFGVRGAIMHLHGSTAAPADHVAAAVELWRAWRRLRR